MESFRLFLRLKKPPPNLLLLLYGYYNLSSGLPEVVFACKTYHISADYILAICGKKEGHQYKPQILYIWHSFQLHLLTCSFKISMICTNLSGWDTPLMNTSRKKNYASVPCSVNKHMPGPHNLRGAEASKGRLSNCCVRRALKRSVSCSASFPFILKNQLGCFPKFVNSFQTNVQIIPRFKYECQWTHSKSSSNVRKD